MQHKAVHHSILISGASIAGLTLAHWLRRYGFEVTVVERASAPRPGGQAAVLRGVAKEVAARMDVLPRIEQSRVHERGLAYVDASGLRKASVPAALSMAAAVEIEILRGDLTGILHEAAGEGVEYLFDDSITELRETEEGLSVTFDRNESRVFHLIVGADGLHSNVRRLAFGPETDFVHHLGACLASFTVPADGLELDDWFLVHNARGGRLVALRREGSNSATAMFAFKAAGLVHDHHDLARQQQVLAEKFAGMGWHTSRLLGSMSQALDFFFDTVSQTRMHRWARGRVALVGDAGYCGSSLSGNSTAMAMVGAYILAGELARAGDDYSTAFDRCHDRMRPYVTACQKLPSGGIDGFLPNGRAAITMRNLSVQVRTSALFRRSTAQSLQQADAITLPSYQAFETTDASSH
ncbi:FAD-dependent monooxygenase [Nocardia yamanashiensis]|uniref:FAD-dependent monooxygenase n=1 Tax=Nocardia yamanashiensis TaxID=209247 RepID=UPI000AEB56A6|nr:FAD-dependent monooxygenase [Nocardia yamanashiensis]